VLGRARLFDVQVRRTDLSAVNLTGAEWGVSPTSLLLAQWGEVSDELCVDLMRYCASLHPRGAAAFDSWAEREDDCDNDDVCPYH